MSQFFKIHPINPQGRLIREAVNILNKDGVIAYPTDAAYALGCCFHATSAIKRIRQIRQLDDQHHFTLLCRDLSEIASYARIDNDTFRWLKKLTPGAFTFLLEATSEVPKKLQHPKRKNIGIRIPENPIALDLLAELNEPLLTTTLILPQDLLPLTDPEEINARIGKQIDLIIDGGMGDIEMTTVVDFIDNQPHVIRQGKGKIK